MTRVYSKNTNRRLRSSSFDKKLSDYNNRFVEDRRLYNPSTFVTPKTTLGKSAVIKQASSSPAAKGVQKTTQMRFIAPKEVITCLRRKQRKEVMHAIKKAGKSGQKRPTRNQLSNIKC